MRYASPYISHTAEAMVKLNTTIKTAALYFENLPTHLPNVACGVVTGSSWRMSGSCVVTL